MSRIVDICYSALSRYRHTKGQRARHAAHRASSHSLGGSASSPTCCEADGWERDVHRGERARRRHCVTSRRASRPTSDRHLRGDAVQPPAGWRALIRDLRALPPARRSARVMVGGWLLVLDPDLWRLLGADGGQRARRRRGRLPPPRIWEGARPGRASACCGAFCHPCARGAGRWSGRRAALLVAAVLHADPQPEQQTGHGDGADDAAGGDLEALAHDEVDEDAGDERAGRCR